MDEKRFSVFDLDHTLLVDNASYRFGRYLYEKGLLDIKPMIQLVVSYFLQRSSLMTLNQLHRLAIQFYFGRQRRSDIDLLAKTFCRHHLSELWYPAALSRWHQAKAEGQKVLLLSSSPDFIVKPIAGILGADEWHGTVYRCDPLGFFFDNGEVLDGELKKKILVQSAQKYHCELSKVTAYSDSILDLPLLSCVGKPIAVRPDKKLKKHSQKLGWQII